MLPSLQFLPSLTYRVKINVLHLAQPFYMNHLIVWCKTHRTVATLIGLLLFLIVSNPSPSQFRREAEFRNRYKYHRMINGFILSVYEQHSGNHQRLYYLAIAGNVIPLQ